jgi:HAE1 family hydrophobic/amphiphilic exporter-1
MVISDAEDFISQKSYKKALDLYRMLDSQLVGSGDLMKINYVRERIESLVRMIMENPTPETMDIIEEEAKTAEERYRSTVVEAEQYFSHDLFKEALYLYRKLEKEYTGSNDTEKIKSLKEKVRLLRELVEDPFHVPTQLGEVGQMAYLDDDGTISDDPVEGFDEGPGQSPFIKKMTAAFLRKNAFLNIVYVLLFAGALYCLFNIPVENMPSLDLGEAYITTYYYGASAEDVENLITTQIEKAIEGTENVEYVKSRSYRNMSSVNVKFVDDSDYRDLFSRIRLQVLNIRSKLPEGCEDPKFLFVDTHWWKPVISVNLFGEASETSRKDLSEKLKTELNSIEGVRDVEITGQSKNEFHVSLSPDKLRKLGVTFAEAVQALQSAGKKIPTGNFGTESSEFILDSGTNFSRQEDVLNLIIRKDGAGNFVRIRDVVTSAMMSHPDPLSIASINGNDTTNLTVRKEDSANSIKIAKQVKSISETFARKHRDDGVKLTYTNDTTKEINESISILNGNLISGIILVVITLWLTIGFRNALFASVGIPFAFLCTIAAVMIAGMSLNSVNLFTFILMSGIMVDDAIVIIENIYRHQQMGKSLRASVIDGMSEIFWPVFSSMMTTMVAFLPMLLIKGAVGSFFAMIPLAVTLTLISSFFEAMIFLPHHIFEWGSKDVEKVDFDEISDDEPKRKDIVTRVWYFFEPVLELFLRHRWKALAGTAILFIVAMSIALLSLLGIVPLIKVKFFPGNYVRYHITVALPSSTPIKKTDAIVRDISTFIQSLGEKQADSVSGTAGYYEDQDYSVLGGSQYGQVVVAMPERERAVLPDNPEKDPVKHIDIIRKKLKQYLTEKYPSPDERPRVKVFPENNGPPSGKAVSIRISGDNINKEIEVSDRIMEFLKQNKEAQDLTDIGDDRASNVNVVRYTPSQEAAYELGIAPGRITEMIAGSLNGIKVGNFQTPNEEVDLKIRVARKLDMAGLSDSGLATPQDILDIPLVEHSSSPIFLRDVATVEYKSEPDSRGRFNGKSTVTLTSDIKSGSDLSPKRLQFLVAQYFDSISRDYPDVTLTFSGESEATGKTFGALYIGLIIAIIGIYLILALQFGDYMQPLIVITAVAFAFIGVTFGMVISRSLFTVGSLMAVVGLAGVTVNNSLILIDFINIRIHEGKTMRQAVKDACRTRIRPVILTAVTNVMGLLPMAIGIPYKSVEWSPMAVTFAAGLSTSTLMILLMIPVEYELAALVKTKIKEWF